MDYGEFHVTLPMGLDWYARKNMVRMQVDNQLFTSNENHRVEIISNCIDTVNILREGVHFTRVFNNYHYKYTIYLSYKYTQTGKMCTKE